MFLPRPEKKQANCSAIDGLVLSWAAAQNQLGTDPVFLENLLFDCDLKNSRAAKAEFDRFIQEIKEQEREALLKLR